MSAHRRPASANTSDAIRKNRAEVWVAACVATGSMPNSVQNPTAPSRPTIATSTRWPSSVGTPIENHPTDGEVDVLYRMAHLPERGSCLRLFLAQMLPKKRQRFGREPR